MIPPTLRKNTCDAPRAREEFRSILHGVRASVSTVAIARRHPLPGDGMTVNISRITTGSAVAAQSSQGDTVTATDWTRSRRIRWTERDIEMLRKYWCCGAGVVAYHLNVAYRLNSKLPYRTVGAIKAKARALGLKAGGRGDE